MARNVDELYWMARGTEGFTDVSEDVFAHRTQELRTAGFLDFEIMYLAQHELNTEAVSMMAAERSQERDEFARDFYAQYPNASAVDEEQAFTSNTIQYYLDNSWTFMGNGAPNPFSLLEKFYQAPFSAHETPTKKRRRATESYDDVIMKGR